MKKFSLLILLPLVLLCSCANQASQPPAAENKKDTMPAQAETKPDLSKLTLAQQTDPQCEMSLAHGIADTALIDGKVYGFCSDYCKKSYLDEHQSVKK